MWQDPFLKTLSEVIDATPPPKKKADGRIGLFPEAATCPAQGKWPERKLLPSPLVRREPGALSASTARSTRRCQWR